jgi:tRNA A37 threonylcarbamoyladenosine synthetase subunit TsaC/SUA5/YrdC
MIPPNENDALFDPIEIRERWEHELDLIIDGGSVPPEETTMIDLTSHVPELIRKGAGDWTPFFADEPA